MFKGMFAKSLLCSLGLFCFFSITTTLAKEIPIEQFTKYEEYSEVQISPTGEYLSVIMRGNENRQVLVVIKRADNSIAAHMGFGSDQDVLEVFWANEERLLLSIAQDEEGYEQPRWTGEIFAINVDGSKKKMIFGYRAGGRDGLGSNMKRTKATNATGDIVNLLRDEPDYVLIQSYPWVSIDGAAPEVLKLNIYNGFTKRVAKVPAKLRGGSAIIDENGQVRMALGQGIDLTNYVYEFEDGDWKMVNSFAEGGSGHSPISYNAKNGRYYALTNIGGTEALLSVDPRSGDDEIVFQDAEVDIDDIYVDPLTNELTAVYYDNGKPNTVIVNDTAENSSVYKSAISAFKGNKVVVTSMTWDGKFAMVEVSSDTNPGDFFLFDVQNKQMEYVMSRRSWLDPLEMAKVVPFKLKSRDGLDLHGYLTLPNGKEPKSLPMVVNPHGGPHGVRDNWQFDQDAQLLANRGYAVLQVNFRGSGGYGLDFQTQGYRNWGTKMQDDITDATQWAIEQGYADEDRVCIYGASYGGYATLMGLVREPDLYQCGISFVGVSNLEMLSEKGTYQRQEKGLLLVERYVGSDEQELKQRSPVNHADKIKAPILFIHGGRDEIVPIEHAEEMREALDEHNKPYEWFVKTRETHGFYSENNNNERLAKMLEFLNQHIGS